MRFAACLLWVAGLACHQADRSASPSATAAQLYGAPLSETRASVLLTDVIATPDRFDGQTVKTEGTISQVCQRMGCWMELRADDNTRGVRVPMAGHSFFLPQTVLGRRATIEGKVVVRPLSEAAKAHFRSEGATELDAALAIEATGVRVDSL